MQYIIPTEDDMLQFGQSLGKLLFPGSFVALYGDLGAGKTALSRGIGISLGTDDVSSPTFTIVQEHETQPPLYHFDVYRLSSGDELEDIGFYEYCQQNGIILMEWPENVLSALPKSRLDIQIIGSGEQARTVVLHAKGQAYMSLLAHLAEEYHESVRN